jgi:hypothetical protein
MTAGGKRKPRYGFGDIVMPTACHGTAEPANLKVPATVLVPGADFAGNLLFVCRFLLQLLASSAALAVSVPVELSFAGDGMEELLHETHWGESSSELPICSATKQGGCPEPSTLVTAMPTSSSPGKR